MSDFVQDEERHGDSISCKNDEQIMEDQATRCFGLGIGMTFPRSIWSKVMNCGLLKGTSSLWYR